MKIIHAILQFALPNHCLICEQLTQDGLCQTCSAQVLKRDLSSCPQCGLSSSSPTQRCGQCLKNPPYFDDTIALCSYSGAMATLIQRYKFYEQVQLAQTFAQLLAQRCRHDADIQAILQEANAILPIPLGRQRLKERGFNQALEMGKPISRLLKIPLETKYLVRIKETKQQSWLNEKQRMSNMQMAFALAPDAQDKIRNQHFILFDDVMTTGATLNEAARLLKQYGARRVTNMVIARTPINATVLTASTVSTVNATP